MFMASEVVTDKKSTAHIIIIQFCLCISFKTLFLYYRGMKIVQWLNCQRCRKRLWPNKSLNKEHCVTNVPVGSPCQTRVMLLLYLYLENWEYSQKNSSVLLEKGLVFKPAPFIKQGIFNPFKIFPKALQPALFCCQAKSFLIFGWPFLIKPGNCSCLHQVHLLFAACSLEQLFCFCLLPLGSWGWFFCFHGCVISWKRMC